MRAERILIGIRVLLYGAMVVVSVLWLVRPLNDPDFFWHLKTGEWVWQHGELPARDPFNFTSESVDSGWARFTLRAYWVSQIGYYLIHSRWGIPGIVGLKLLIGATLVLTLLKSRRGDPVVHAALTLAVLPLLFGVFLYDRPQAFSFVFFALLVACLDRVLTAPTPRSGFRSYLAVPLLMLAWANTHGGYALGLVTIALYLAGEGAKFAHPGLRPAGGDRYRRLLIVGLGGLGASLVNPNAWRALDPGLFAKEGTVVNAEYLSTVRFFQSSGQSLLYIFWTALILAALSCLFRAARPDLTRVALLAGTGVYGFFFVRHIPFFLIVAVPVIAAFLSGRRTGKWGPPALAVASLLVVAWFSRGQLPTRERIDTALRVNEAQYPVRAADFVIANELKGNLYNTWVWGGYLLWRLAPERRVFVDGRGLNPQANFLSSAIALALPQPAGSPLSWRNSLRQYGVGYLIIPSGRSYFFDGARGLRAALREAPEWVPVFADETALVYVLNSPEHRGVIERHRLTGADLPAGA